MKGEMIVHLDQLQLSMFCLGFNIILCGSFKNTRSHVLFELRLQWGLRLQKVSFTLATGAQ